MIVVSGYQLTPMRNRKHFTLAYDHYGGGFMNTMTPGMHVYKTGGGGRYTNCIMRKHSSGQSPLLAHRTHVCAPFIFSKTANVWEYKHNVVFV